MFPSPMRKLPRLEPESINVALGKGANSLRIFTVINNGPDNFLGLCRVWLGYDAWDIHRLTPAKTRDDNRNHLSSNRLFHATNMQPIRPGR